jgi:hypothetical protein
VIDRRPPASCALLATIVAVCAGCAAIGAPSTGDRLAVERGEKTILLLRVTAEMDGERIGPFDHDLIDDNVNLGLGGFETGGEVRRVDSPNAFSREAYRDGWVYFILEPGTHYLAVAPPYRFVWGDAPRWRLDAPAGSQVVYAGTLHLVCHGSKLLFGGKRIDGFDDFLVVDESSLAGALAGEYLSEHPPPRTTLMRRQSGPIILTTPGR